MGARNFASGRSSTLFAVVAAGMFGLVASAPAPGVAAGPGLPRTYQSQAIDTPVPALAAGLGAPLINVGDVNRDGEDDLFSLQTQGSAGGDGVLFVHSGETGELIDRLNAPDPGGAGDRSIVDRYADRLTDLGSCANPPAENDPDQTCDSLTVGAPDGVDEIMVSAQGVDVGGVPDVGRAWILDGATRAVLKRIDMPPSDRAEFAARRTENPGLNLKAGFSRTVFSPRGLPPCAGNAGVGDCLAATVMPTAVRIGDMDGGGRPEVVIGANRFPESPATAHPASHCAKSIATVCAEAGRTYVYRGEEIAGSNPAVILDGTGPGQTPPKRLKNLVAQADEGETNENFGHAQMPVGDVGVCRTGGAFPAVSPGDRCPASSSTNVPDGRPEVIVSAIRADTPLANPDPANFEVGVSFLVDGATGAILYTYNHPEPQANSLFGQTLHQTFAYGDLGGTTLPDVIIPASRQSAQGHFGAGRAYVINGNFKTTDTYFGQLNDPTPTTIGQFASPSEAVGDLVPERPGHEALIGAGGQNAGRADAITDVHFFNPFSEQSLQTISDPDQQLESSFGYSVVPLGDLNEDGFLDLAVGSFRWDAPTVGGVAGFRDQGRFHILRSDDSPAPRAASPPTTGVPPAQATPTTIVATLSGRSITLAASKGRVARRGSLTLTGVIDAASDPAGCEPGQVVSLQRRRSRSAPYRTFRKVRSGSGGAFSVRVKPTSTQVYRALVERTARCLGAASGGKTVKVGRAASRSARPAR